MNEELPKLDFTTFLLSISSACFMGLGLVGSDDQSKPKVDLQLARQNIDLLELMLEKTKGNRNPEEDKLIQTLLFELRMRYVQVKNEAKSNS